MTLGDYIRAYRKEAKLSQREFAKKCGLSNGYISMLERGINPKTKEPITPSLIQLKKLADGMCVTVNDILLEVEDMPVDVGVNVKEQPTVSDGLSEAEKKLLTLFRKVPEAHQGEVLDLVETALKMLI